MKNKKENNKTLTLIFAIIFFILAIVCSVLVKKIDSIEEKEVENEIQILTKATSKTVQGTLENYNSKYITRKANTIYVEFSEDLFKENGDKNEQYFELIVKDLSKIEDLRNKNFYVIDKEKDITLYVKRDEENEGQYEIEYNRNNNFYEDIDGKSYMTIDKVKIMEGKEIFVTSEELRTLSRGNMFFRKIKNSLGVGQDLGNGYTSFKDGKFILKLLNGKVRNMVFTDKYEGGVINRISFDMSLAEIKETLKEPSKENKDYGYLLYRTSDFYIFIYEDEISVYGYSHFKNELFEQYLTTYIEDGNLDNFINSVSSNWKMFYDKNEYIPEQQYANLTFPSIGVEIKIEDNNSKGITLYNNYYFTEITKELIKDGKISLNAEEDLLEKMEQSRRNEFLEVNDV